MESQGLRVPERGSWLEASPVGMTLQRAASPCVSHRGDRWLSGPASWSRVIWWREGNAGSPVAPQSRLVHMVLRLRGMHVWQPVSVDRESAGFLRVLV